MKVLRNGNRAWCHQCISVGAIVKESRVLCANCGSSHLRGDNGKRFVPVFGTDRRCPERIWKRELKRRDDHAYT